MEEQRLRESKSRATKVLIGCILLTTFTYGTMNALSLYVTPICERVGVEATQVSLLFSIVHITALLGSLAAAALVEKVNPRILMLVGIAGYAVFFTCLYLGDSIFMIYAGAVGFGLSLVFAGFAVVQPVVLWWHAKDTGKKISYLTISSFVATMVLAPGIVFLLENVGFGTTVLFNGIGFGAIMLLAVVFLISGKPETYGLKPYGYEEDGQDAEPQEEYVPTGLAFKQVVRTVPFWAIMFAAAVVMVPIMGFNANQALVYQSVGFDAAFASTLMSVFSGAAIVWCLLYGVLSDKMGPGVANMAFTVITICSALGFVVIGGKAGAVFLALTIGAGCAYSGMIAPVTFRSLFGTRAIGTLIPVGLVAGFLGSAAAPPIASAINAATGSYTVFMIISVVILAVVLALLALATSKKSLAKIKAIEEAGE